MRVRLVSQAKSQQIVTGMQSMMCMRSIGAIPRWQIACECEPAGVRCDKLCNYTKLC